MIVANKNNVDMVKKNIQINKGNRVQGFVVKEITALPQIDSIFYEMEHEKTGAKLGWMKNDDMNKTFSITFKTIPYDDSGVFHILEHSVLQGSKRYPVKAPFVHLMKSSMNTFLNAMTFQDKTMFPVASRNATDFENLIRVYMDAVLHPLLLENENIFLQEGWHVEFDGEEPSYNGVVFNEMKGDHSSVDSLLYLQTIRGLFPENGYGFESGGDPSAITSLDYKQLCKTYRKFYHPSNAIILLDGDIELEKILNILNQEFLNDFDKKEEIPDPLWQKPIIEKREVSFAADDETGYLGLGYVLGKYSDQKEIYAAKILADYLVKGNESPLKHAFIEKGLCFDVTSTISDDIMQPFLLFTFRNIDPSAREQIESLFVATLKKILEEGIDKEKLESLICLYEFNEHERDFEGEPSGLMNEITCLNSWLHGSNPLSGFETESIFTELRKEVSDGTFSEFINKFFLNNPHKSSVLMRPDENYLEAEECAEKERVHHYYENLSELGKKELKAKEMQLKEWQEKEDSSELIACIPKLKLQDIKVEPIKNPCKVLPDGTIFHKLNTKGITYLRLYFPIEKQLQKDLSVITFLSNFYGNLSLENLNANELETKKDKFFGEFKTYVEILPKVNTQEAQAYFCVDTSFLQKNENEALKLLHEIIEKTNLNDHDSIETILYQEKENLTQSMIMDGHSMAVIQAESTLSEEAYLKNMSEGPAYLAWLEEIAEDLEKNLQPLSEKMKCLAGQILSINTMSVGVTTDSDITEYASRVKAGFHHVIYPFDQSIADKCPQGHVSDDTFLTIAAPVAYSALTLSMKECGIENTGAWLVLSKLVSMNFLWNEIRVLGGAYGTGMSVDISGMVSIYSYRDPNPKKSLKTFLKIADYLLETDKKDMDLSSIIIGTIADTEFVVSQGTMGKIADKWYLSGITDEFRKERRKQILSITYEDLIKMAKELETMYDSAKYCIVGSTDVIEDNK